MLNVVCCGSYEGGLHGWQFSPDKAGLALRFSFVAHTGCVRTVAVLSSKRLLISGGDDEVIRVFSLKSMKQIGEAGAQQGTITALAFCGVGHALSASSDGTICVWRLSNWACVQILGGHKEAVLSLASHPSGRMALSTGSDRTVRLWDLTEGRCAFITRTKGAAQLVRWSSDGRRYLLAVGGRVEIRDVGGVSTVTVAAVTHETIVLDALFVDQRPGLLTSCFATADAAGALTLWKPDGAECLWQRRRPKRARVKALELVPLPTAQSIAADCGELQNWSRHLALLAATSDGNVEIWRLYDPAEVEQGPEAEVSVGTRLTCLCAVGDPAAAYPENASSVQSNTDGRLCANLEGRAESSVSSARRKLKDRLRAKKRRILNKVTSELK